MQNTASPNPLPESWRLRKGAKQSQGEWYSRGYLPHRDGDAFIQHVTAHLADSLPESAIERIDLSIKLLPEAQRRNERRNRLHELIDAGHGSCILRIPAVADMVQDSLLYLHEKRYCLHAWVVMPNHFHVLFQPINDWSMAKIVSSWKKFTARKIRDYLRNKGQYAGTEKIPGPESILQGKSGINREEGLINANQ
ncbi:MAG: transposase, partial [Acidobacteriota bacterium]